MLLTLTFLAGCSTVNQKRLNEASRVKAEADQVDSAIVKVTKLPSQPNDCKRSERSGVADGDRLDIALIKTDKALSRANRRVKRCAVWYDDLKRSRNREVS